MDSKRKALLEAVDVTLHPCANCGSTNVALRRTIESDSVFWHAECLKCGMRTPSFEEIGDNNEAVSTPNRIVLAMLDAITYVCDVWNKRTYHIDCTSSLSCEGIPSNIVAPCDSSVHIQAIPRHIHNSFKPNISLPIDPNDIHWELFNKKPMRNHRDTKRKGKK